MELHAPNPTALASSVGADPRVKISSKNPFLHARIIFASNSPPFRPICSATFLLGEILESQTNLIPAAETQTAYWRGVDLALVPNTKRSVPPTILRPTMQMILRLHLFLQSPCLLHPPYLLPPNVWVVPRRGSLWTSPLCLPGVPYSIPRDFRG